MREKENETNRNKQQTTNRLSKTLICIIISQHLKTTITFYLSCSFSLLSFSFGFNYIIISMIRGIKIFLKSCGSVGEMWCECDIYHQWIGKHHRISNKSQTQQQ